VQLRVRVRVRVRVRLARLARLANPNPNAHLNSMGVSEVKRHWKGAKVFISFLTRMFATSTPPTW